MPGVLVVSYDLIRAKDSHSFSVRAETRKENRRSGDALNLPKVGTDPLRVTLVINGSREDVILPEALGAVPPNSLAVYAHDGTAFGQLLVSAGNVSSNIFTGFLTGLSLRSLAQGRKMGAWFDNFGVWDSAEDTVNGVGVLALAPGTVVNDKSK